MNNSNGSNAPMSANLVGSLSSLRHSFQRARIQFNNRAKAIEQGRMPATPDEIALISQWHETLLSQEAAIEKDIRAYGKKIEGDYPLLHQVVQLRGISYVLAFDLLYKIDFARAARVSSLWLFAGYGNDKEGKRIRLVKGQKARFSRELKITCRKIGLQMVRHSSPYAKVFEKAVENYRMKYQNPELVEELRWMDSHVENAALGNMIKLFLSHLWERGRRLAGLPVLPPYAISILGHSEYLSPEEFGWPPI